MTIKNYLRYEDARNKSHTALYEEILQAAFGHSEEVVVGHHLTFLTRGDLRTVTEIPSADTMIFDHDIMRRIFGDRAVEVMVQCAAVPCEGRDQVLSEALLAIRADLGLRPSDIAPSPLDESTQDQAA